MKLVYTMAVAIVASTAASAAHSETNNSALCEITQTDGVYSGICAIPCDVAAPALATEFECTVARTVDVSGEFNDAGDEFLGKMEGKFPEDPDLFLISPPKGQTAGVAKTPYGWFDIESYQQSGDEINLSFNVEAFSAPTEDDIKILEIAASKLLEPGVWSNEDTRGCPPDAKKFSLFCALEAATIEVEGLFHYRQPAMQVVRRIVQEVGSDRIHKHRLMDYNNHPETTLDDVVNIIELSIEDINDQINP